MAIPGGSGLLTDERSASHEYVNVLRRRTHDGANQSEALAANEEPSPTKDIAEAANKQHTNTATQSLDDWDKDNIGTGTDVLIDDREDIHLDRKIKSVWRGLSSFLRPELTGRT